MAKAEDKDRVLLDEEAEFRRNAQQLVKNEFASPTPLWYRVIMFSLMILGVLWIMTFYITSSVFPVPGIGSWNIAIGIGLLMVGLMMTTRWR